MAIFSGNKKTNPYYDFFAKTMGFAKKGADFLNMTLSDFDPNEISCKVRELHVIEHNSDMEKHDMMGKLAREFITPIEREDIILIANIIDDIVDSIEDILQRIYMYNIKTMREEVMQFTQIIVNCCDKLSQVMADFPDFRRNEEKLRRIIIEVNTLESDADKLYIDSVRRLFTQENDSIVILAWKGVFDKLEQCCDACETAANTIESVMMKNL